MQTNQPRSHTQQSPLSGFCTLGLYSSALAIPKAGKSLVTTTGDSPTPPKQMQLFTLAVLSLFTLPGLPFSWTPHKGSCPCFPLAPSASELTPVLPHGALHGVICSPFWELWVGNYLFTSNHLLIRCWLHTPEYIKPTFQKTILILK